VSAPTAVVTARPRKATRFAWVLAVLIVAVFVLVATALHGSTESGKGVFRTSDQVAMIGLGLLAGAGILLFTRPRVEADAHHIKIRNVIGGYDLPWEVVRAVTFNRGAPWASLELQDDDVVAVMAIQAADKLRAVESVKALRALLAAHQAGTAAPGAPSGTDPSAGGQ
jgi:hypothetical protein